MDSETTVTVLVLLLLLAALGLTSLTFALARSRSHLDYLRGEMNKHRCKALRLEGDENDRGLEDRRPLTPSSVPTGMGWELDPPPERTWRGIDPGPGLPKETDGRPRPVPSANGRPRRVPTRTPVEVLIRRVNRQRLRRLTRR
jgi:hypothetical protein